MGVKLEPGGAEVPHLSLLESQSLVGEKNRSDHNTAGGTREGGEGIRVRGVEGLPGGGM